MLAGEPSNCQRTPPSLNDGLACTQKAQETGRLGLVVRVALKYLEFRKWIAGKF